MPETADIKSAIEKEISRDNLVLEFENVSVKDEISKEEIKNVSFKLAAGENLVILGPEGSGKRLVLELVTGQRLADSGTVKFLGNSLSEKSQEDWQVYRSCLGLVSKNYGLINNLNVLDNVCLPMRYHSKLSDAEINDRAYQFLLKYMLFDQRNTRPPSLTENEKLRVAFVRALISQPLLFVIDHSLSAHCPLAVAKFLELARDDFENPLITYLVSTYDQRKLSSQPQKYMLFYEGQVVFSGSLSDIENSENPFLRQYLAHPLFGPMRPFFEKR